MMVPFVTPSTYDTNRMGNSLVLLGPTSTTLDTTTKVAGEGLSVNSTVTKKRCTVGSQLVSSAMEVWDFLAAHSIITCVAREGVVRVC